MTQTRTPLIVSLVAPSGTGKTTYLEVLIPRLTERGLRVAAVKHHRHNFDIDRPGKDTQRLRAAGASRVAIVNDREIAVYGDVEPALTLQGLVSRYLSTVDLVLVENYRAADVARVVVCRQGSAEQYDATDERVIAVISDYKLAVDKPHFPLDDPGPFAAFLADLLNS